MPRRTSPLPALLLLPCLSSCREDAVYLGFEQVIDGSFDQWPDQLPEDAEGEVWTPVRGGAFTRKSVSIQPYLSVDAGVATDSGGARTRIPTVPGASYQLELTWKGGPGEVQLVAAGEEADPEVRSLARAGDWTHFSAAYIAPSQGVSLRLMDKAGGDRLDVDDLSLRLLPPVEGTVQGEPSVQFVFVVHIEPEVDSEDEYQAWWSDLDWLKGECESRGIPMTVLSNGKFMEWTADAGDEGKVQALLSAGHEVGTHAHAVHKNEEGDWVAMDTYVPEIAEDQWSDARAAVDALVGEENNRTVAIYAAAEFMPGLMKEFGFTLDLSSVVTQEQGGTTREVAAWQWLGHHPHHPFRPADSLVAGEGLLAEASAPYVSMLHMAQIGYPESHGIPCEPADYQRQLAYLLERRQSKADLFEEPGEDLPWVFGLLTHVGVFGDGVDTDLLEFLDWLEAEHLNPGTGGEADVEAVTAQTMLASFHAWELEHPGETPFSFVLPQDDP